MSTPLRPLSELTSQAKKSLIKEMGIVDAIRVFNHFRSGSGDYTREREHMLKTNGVKSIVAEIKSQRSSEK